MVKAQPRVKTLSCHCLNSGVVLYQHRVLEDDHIVVGQQRLLCGDVDLEIGVGGIADGVHERRVGPRLGQVGVAYDKENLGQCPGARGRPGISTTGG
jgi:hypothetical protein